MPRRTPPSAQSAVPHPLRVAAPRTAVVLSAVVALLVTACGTPPGSTGAEPADDVCRAPLGDDEPNPIGRSDGEHEALRGDWWTGLNAALMEDHADETGGMWLDQEAGEVVVMMTSDDPAPLLDELRGSVGPDHQGQVVCMQAEHTHDELMDLLGEVSARLQPLATPGSRALDTVGNRIEVEYETDLDDVEEALGELADHPAVHLQRPACAEIADPPPDAIALPGGGSTCVGMDALTGGMLAGDVEAGCLWFESEQGRTSILWPRGWWVSPDGVVHDHYGEARAEVGDDVRSGGGSGQDQNGAIPGECRVSGEVWILSSLDPA